MIRPVIEVKKLQEAMSTWIVTTRPYIDTRYELLNHVYANVQATVCERTLCQDIVSVVGSDGPLPDKGVEAALHRLVLAHWWRAQTDSNPPKTWRAVEFLVDERSPEAQEVARSYLDWNGSMARELWSMSKNETDPRLRYTFRKHSEARYSVDSKLREFVKNAPGKSELS